MASRVFFCFRLWPIKSEWVRCEKVKTVPRIQRTILVLWNGLWEFLTFDFWSASTNFEVLWKCEESACLLACFCHLVVVGCIFYGNSFREKPPQGALGNCSQALLTLNLWASFVFKHHARQRRSLGTTFNFEKRPPQQERIVHPATEKITSAIHIWKHFSGNEISRPQWLFRFILSIRKEWKKIRFGSVNKDKGYDLSEGESVCFWLSWLGRSLDFNFLAVTAVRRQKCL